MIVNLIQHCTDPAAFAKAAAEIAAQLVQNVPDEMKNTANWVNFELVPNPQGHSGFDKVPINPKNGSKAQSNNPDTWGTFDQACDRLKKKPGKVHGVGLMLGNSQFAGFDDDEIYAKLLDDMLDINEPGLTSKARKERHKEIKAAGAYDGVTIDEMTATALNTGDFYGADLIQSFNSYTEISPSGKGLHVYFVGKLPPTGRKKEYFEMYEDGRFLTVTGEPYKEFTTMNAPSEETIAEYHKKYIIKGIYEKQKEKTAPPPPPQKPTQSRPTSLDDNQIITKALNNAKFSNLWNGITSGYPSQNEADLALCELLAFWTAADPVRMDRLFRQSRLYRDKWDRRQSGTTYGAITIGKAIALCPKYYDPNYYSGDFSVTIKPTHNDDIVTYNFDGTPETQPAGAAAPADSAADQSQSEETVRLSDLTLEQIKALTTEQWNGIIYQHYKTPAETESVTQKFARLYERCCRGRLLQDNGLLPLYIQPIIKNRREKGLIYTTIAGFEINPVPLARSIQEDHHIINIPSRSSTAGLLYIYKNGKYERIDGEEERGVVRDRLELIDHMGKIWNTKSVKDTSLLLHSPSETHELDEFNADETIINFQNGILDLNTGNVYPHTHTRLTTVQLPLIYDPNAGTDTPIFDSMIDHFAGGDDEVKTLLMQMCALAISNVDMGNLKCFLMMYGARDSGKSQLFKLLHRLIGTKNTHTTTLHKLENNNFEPMNLYGKRFAGHAELDNNSTVRHVGIIKALTGGDHVSGEVKCGGVYDFCYKGVLMFCSNDKPRLPSADTAFYDRLRLVYVAKSVDTKDLHFLDKMWTERQRIVNKLLPHLLDVINDEKVIDPVSSKALKKAYKAENNPAIEFFTECCEMRPHEEYDMNARKGITDGQDSKFIYNNFYHWCLDCGYTAHDIPTRLDFAKTIGRYLASESKSESEDVKVHKRNGNFYTFKLRPYMSDTKQETDTAADIAGGAAFDNFEDLI